MNNNNQHQDDLYNPTDWSKNHLKDNTKGILATKKTGVYWITGVAILLVYPGILQYQDKEYVPAFIILIIVLAALYAWHDLFSYKELSSILTGWCQLDPFPGQIGGKVAGKISLIMPGKIHPETKVWLHYTAKDRRWSESQVVKATQTGGEWQINFSFDVPKEKKAGEILLSGKYWKIVTEFFYNEKWITKEFWIPVYAESELKHLNNPSPKPQQFKQQVSKETTRFNHLIFIVFLFLGTGLNLGAIFSYFYTQSFLTHAIQVKGEVYEVNQKEEYKTYERTDKHGHTRTVTTNEKVKLYCPTIAFETLKGQEIRFKVSCDTENTLKEWMKVDVLYGAQSPAKTAILNTFSDKWGITIGLLIFGAVFLLFCLPFLLQKSKSQKNSTVQTDDNSTLFKRAIIFILFSPYLVISLSLLQGNWNKLTELIPEIKLKHDYLNDESLSEMKRLYLDKIHSKDYLAWEKLNYKDRTYQTFKREKQIKDLRSQVAAKVELPIGEKLHLIPTIQQPPIIDGVIDKTEWDHSLKIYTYPKSLESQLFLVADEKWLYLAIDVPKDIKVSNYRNINFIYHINLMPEIYHERINVSGSEKNSGKLQQLKGARGTFIFRDNDSFKNPQSINDSFIYQDATGASTLINNRQYEAKILLKEAGLHPGVPFAAKLFIIGEPILKNNKFIRNVDYGRLKPSNEPVWFKIKVLMP